MFSTLPLAGLAAGADFGRRLEATGRTDGEPRLCLGEGDIGLRIIAHVGIPAAPEAMPTAYTTS